MPMPEPNQKNQIEASLKGFEDQPLADAANRRQTPMAAFQTLLGIASNKDHVSLAQLRS